MFYAYMCVLIAVMLQGFDYLYHAKDLSYLKFESNDIKIKEFRKAFKNLAYKKLDNYFAIFPFLWCYLYIIASIIAFHEINSLILRIVLILFVSGRMRSLQEIGHFAIHGALCPNLKYAMKLGNIFYQFPTFMPDAVSRRQIHVLEHHNSINMSHDPDLKELMDKGFIPGITNSQFWQKLFYYLTPSGFLDRTKECWGYIKQNPGSSSFYLRILVVTAIIMLFVYLQLYKELLFLYIVPVLVTYPLFYWLAHVALHRWYAQCDEGVDYHTRELILGRPTNFTGIAGFFIKHNLCPVGDAYHLAHSLFPIIRWTHLPKVDAILKQHCKLYNENASFGLFIPTKKYPTIFSELRERMIYKVA